MGLRNYEQMYKSIYTTTKRIKKSFPSPLSFPCHGASPLQRKEPRLSPPARLQEQKTTKVFFQQKQKTRESLSLPA